MGTEDGNFYVNCVQFYTLINVLVRILCYLNIALFSTRTEVAVSCASLWISMWTLKLLIIANIHLNNICALLMEKKFHSFHSAFNHSSAEVPGISEWLRRQNILLSLDFVYLAWKLKKGNKNENDDRKHEEQWLIWNIINFQNFYISFI